MPGVHVVKFYCSADQLARDTSPSLFVASSTANASTSRTILRKTQQSPHLLPSLTNCRSAPVARRPKAAAAATGGGSNGGGGGGIVVGPVAGHSEKQVEWLGRIDYYGGREMWRKAEEKFQQVRACGLAFVVRYRATFPKSRPTRGGGRTTSACAGVDETDGRRFSAFPRGGGGVASRFAEL